ncbi:HBS1-like protein [Geranomyces michiganensis]|nr:HBS1-like protein [Geranomyces michiganensis]
MSRHRNLRNLDLDDELDDDYDDYYEEEDEGDDHHQDYAYDREGAKTVQYHAGDQFAPPSSARPENAPARTAINLVDEVISIIGPDFPRDQISAALRDAGQDVQGATNILLDQGPRRALPPGLLPPLGIAAPPGLSKPAPASNTKGQPVQAPPIVTQAEDDGLEFQTTAPVNIHIKVSTAPRRRLSAKHSRGHLVPALNAVGSTPCSCSPPTRPSLANAHGHHGPHHVGPSFLMGIADVTPPAGLRPASNVLHHSLSPVSPSSDTAIESVPEHPTGFPAITGGLHVTQTHAVSELTPSSDNQCTPAGLQPLARMTALAGSTPTPPGLSTQPSSGLAGTLSEFSAPPGLSTSRAGGQVPTRLGGLAPGSQAAGLPLSLSALTSGSKQGIGSGLSALGTLTPPAGKNSPSLSPSALNQGSGSSMLSASLLGLSNVPTAPALHANPLGALSALEGEAQGKRVAGPLPLSLLGGMSGSAAGISSLAGISAPQAQATHPSAGGGPLSLSQLAGSSFSTAAGIQGLAGSAPLPLPLTDAASTLMSGTDAIKSALAALGNSTPAVPSVSQKPTPFRSDSGVAGATFLPRPVQHPPPVAAAHHAPVQNNVRVPNDPPRNTRELLSPQSLFPEFSSRTGDTVFSAQPLRAAPSPFAQFFTDLAPKPVVPVANLAILHPFLSSSAPAGRLANGGDAVKPFRFDSPSPDDVVGKARQQSSQAKSHSAKTVLKPNASAPQSQAKSNAPSMTKTTPASTISATSESVTQLQQDMKALGFASPAPSVARTASSISVASSSESLLSAPGMAKTPSSTGRASPKIKRVDVTSALAVRDAEKLALNLVVVGHVDAGKSTLMGHMLYLLGEVSDRAMRKFEREAEKMRKASFAFAWVLDETEEERSRGVTIDVAVNKFETPKRRFTVLDAPGHRDFVPNMMSGAAQADVAILVVDATNGEFETGFESGGQTREHAVLLRSLGVLQLIVAVNKLDVVGWSQARFDEITAKLTRFLTQDVGFKKSKVWFIPTSGFTGENLVKRAADSPLSAWYQGPTLLEQIDAFESPERAVDKPFRLAIVDCFKGGLGGGGGGGAVSVSGRVEGGSVQVGDSLLVLPINETGVVKGLEVGEEAVKWAVAGDNVLMSLSGVDMTHVNVGSILCDPSNPLPVTTHFSAKIVTFDIAIPLTIGVPVVLHYQSGTEQATITKLVAVLDRATGAVAKKNPRALTKGMSATVEVRTRRPICLDVYRKSRELGRFLMRSGLVTVAGGVVQEILSYEKGGPREES